MVGKIGTSNLAITDFTLRELLGTGGFGAVYRAEVNRPDQCNGLHEVAIKMIPKSKIQTPTLRRRVANEVEVHWQLNHPAILNLYSFFENAEYVCLVMELCENRELFQYMQKRTSSLASLRQSNASQGSRNQMAPLAESEVRTILHQVVSGLQYLHANGIIHRDLKLSNLLLTKTFQLKIADFGLATKVTGEQKTMCGTPNYISPEVISRQPYGIEADVWSLGCLMYTLLVGQPPFESEQVVHTLSKVSRAEYSLPASLSTDACDLIRQLLQVNPHQRIYLKDLSLHPFFTKYDMDSTLVPPEVSALHYISQLQCTSQESQSYDHDQSNPRLSRPHLRTINATSNNRYGQPPELTTNSKRHPGRPLSAPPSSNILSLHLPTPYATPRNQSLISDLHADRENRHPRIELHRHSAHSQQQQLTPQSESSPYDYGFNSPMITVEKLQPLSTTRLKPLKQATKHGIVELLASGDVIMEFNSDKYILVISPDGNMVRIFERGHVTVFNNKIDDTKALRTYALDKLPEKYHRKYKYAGKFVDLVRSKTPKIVFYSPQAKCVLMENTPQADFEVHFYNGTRIHYVMAKQALEIKSSDSLLPLSIDMSSLSTKHVTGENKAPKQQRSHESLSGAIGSPNSNTVVPLSYREYVRHTQDCLRQCLDIEKSVKFDTTVRYPLILKSSSTPVISGNILLNEQQQANAAKSHHPSNLSSWSGTPTAHSELDSSRSRSLALPTTRLKLTPAVSSPSLTHGVEHYYGDSGVKQVDDMRTLPGPYLPKCLSGSALSTPPSQLSGSIGYGLSSRHQNDIAFIEHVGWCTRDSSQTHFTMLFVDGSSLAIETKSQSVWYGTVRTAGILTTTKYLINKDMPADIKIKLGHFPQFVKLMSNRHTSQTGT